MCFYQCFLQILICWSFFSEFYTHNWHNDYINCNCLFHLHTCDLLRPWNTWIIMYPASIIKRKRQRIDTSSAGFFSVRIMQATCAQLQQKERLEQELSVSKDDSWVIPATCMCWIDSMFFPMKTWTVCNWDDTKHAILTSAQKVSCRG